jgi:hypothetical protein
MHVRWPVLLVLTLLSCCGHTKTVNREVLKSAAAEVVSIAVGNTTRRANGRWEAGPGVLDQHSALTGRRFGVSLPSRRRRLTSVQSGSFYLELPGNQESFS